MAFEIGKMREIASQRNNRLKERFVINYTISLEQYKNSVDKKLAHQKLPIINHLISYPKTPFLNKKGTVLKIHTGVNEPIIGKN